MVHPVPPGGFAPYTFDADATATFEQWLAKTEEVGLYVQYDMRNSYLNLSSVQFQVEYLRNRSNILMWYTADEGDGNGDPRNASRLAYDTIYENDGYHPVSTVLNCENYFWLDYGFNGADVIMYDPYPIALNGRWSKPYQTECTNVFGDSGCDNCDGNFFDISTRIESGKNRARLAGGYRTKAMVIVPQAFDDGQQEFWWRVPFGWEAGAVTNILAWNHGATGSVAWNYQGSTLDIIGNSSDIANLILSQKRFIVDAYDSRKEVQTNQSFFGANGYDVSTWSIPNSNGTNMTEILILAANQNYGPIDSPTWTISLALNETSCNLTQVLYGDVVANPDGSPAFIMNRTSVAAAICVSQ